ncbi:hypothetical protein DRO26_01560 [Candidatus Bathyarchaeota archaeon]|nr:MAG: hypothetical protein DRO26_01560 [Candidatus Bathyarchaeota archaeon]
MLGEPRGSLIVVCGCPGTGKTVYCATVAYSLVSEGKKCVYVSFIEDKDYFFRNMKNFGMDFKKMEEEDRFLFLDIVSPGEAGLQAVTNNILEAIERLNAEMVVVDSFSALEMAFPKKSDVRVFLHHIFSRVVRRMDCTSYVVVEGEEVTTAMPSYIADAVVLLKTRPIEGGRVLREFHIVKTRWGEKDFSPKLFTLHQGFKTFKSYRFVEPRERKRFEPIPDTNDRFSSGVNGLDKILGGGYPKGSVVLWDVGENVPLHAFAPFIIATECNFINQGRLVVVLPTKGVDATFKKKLHEGHIDKEAYGRNLFIVQYTVSVEKLEPYMIEFDPNIEMLQERISSFITHRKREIGEPILVVVGWDMLEHVYDPKGLTQIFNFFVIETKTRGDLMLVVTKPDVKQIETLKDIADVHIKLRMFEGNLVLYCEKPYTQPYIVDFDTDKGFRIPKPIPVK